MAIVSMAAVMTSCSNDNDVVNDLDPANKPAARQEVKDEKPVEAYVDILLPVTDVQLDMMDITVNYTVNGESHSVTPADMEEIAFPNNLTELQPVMGQGAAKLLSYRLNGSFTQKQLQEATIECVSTRNDQGVENHKDDQVNCMVGFFYNITRTDGVAAQLKGYATCLQGIDLTKDNNIDQLFKSYQGFGEKIHMYN